jgi:hypothetical protein
MWWLLTLPLQFVIIYCGIRRDQREGVWLWSKAVFFLAFAALECVIVIVPIMTMDLRSPRFLPIFGTASVIAALNFIWFIVVMRRWKLPDGRTSLEAARGLKKPG